MPTAARTRPASDPPAQPGRSRPKVSFGSWAFAFGPFAAKPWTFGSVVDFAARLGYDGIEINGFRPHPHDEDYANEQSCARLRRRIEAAGLGVSAYAPDFRSTPPADAPVDDVLDRVDSALAFCRRLGIPILRTDTVSPPGPYDRVRVGQLVAVWRLAAERAQDVGVRLVWEFEPGFFLNRPSEVIATVQAVDHPNFSLLFDTSHAYTGAVRGARQGPAPELLAGGVAEYAALVRPYLGHLHLIDSDGSLHDDETSAHLGFGAGHIDFAAVLDAARPQVEQLPWWTVDFCFNSDTEALAGHARDVVADLAGSARPGSEATPR